MFVLCMYGTGVCRAEKEKITCDFSPAFTSSTHLVARVCESFGQLHLFPLELPFLTMNPASRRLCGCIIRTDRTLTFRDE